MASGMGITVSITQVVGVGGEKAPKQSKELITFQFEDGQTIVIRPYIMQLPHTLPGLIGLDVLSQLGLVLTTDQHFVPWPLGSSRPF